MSVCLCEPKDLANRSTDRVLPNRNFFCPETSTQHKEVSQRLHRKIYRHRRDLNQKKHLEASRGVAASETYSCNVHHVSLILRRVGLLWPVKRLITIHTQKLIQKIFLLIYIFHYSLTKTMYIYHLILDTNMKIQDSSFRDNIS